MGERSKLVALALLAAAAMFGCSGGPAVDGEITAALSTAFANDKTAYDFFVSKGLTNFQAAGIVGNLDQESGVDPASVQFGGGPGRGIAQWSVGGRWDSSASDNVLWYAGTKGEAAGSLNLQLEFIWYELTSIGYGFAQLKATTNLTDATVAFMDKFEICGTCAQSQRIAYAQSVLNAYGSTPSYGAMVLTQSWPSAAMPPLTVKCGQSVAAKIVLKNTGSQTWNSSTKLGTTMPRDRTSIFAGSDWLSPSRAAAISGTVAPNADGTLTFSFHGPTGAACVPGTYHELFAVVQEGAAWFSDPGQGGPADNQLAAAIDLVPANSTSADLGGGGPTGSDDAGATPGGGDGGDTGDGGSPSLKAAQQAGCSVAFGGKDAGALGALMLVLLFAVASLRLRRRGVEIQLP